MGKKLGTLVHETLKAAQEESRAGELATLGEGVKTVLQKRLGGTDVFGTEEEWSGGLLRIVADECGVAVTYHLGGTLSQDGGGGSRLCYRVDGGDGRAFKFLRHSENEMVAADDFFGAGFPYLGKSISLSKVTGGTVARVKTDIQRVFCTDAVCRVTAYSIEDVRVYSCGQKLIDAVRIVFEESISDVGGEWDRIFRLLSL